MENNADDVETLREKLVELSNRNLISQTKKHLMDKRRCTEKVLRKIMAEYEERCTKSAKAEMAFALVGLLPSLIEKSGMFLFKDAAQNFSAKIIADKNTMFCIMDLMPVVENGDYYMKYICAEIFMSSLCANQVRFGSKPDDEEYFEDIEEEEPQMEAHKKWESQTQSQNNQNKEKT